ncbi:MAG TPA: polysaccharide biosynthesis C-terminal domain-containing protein [Candidatus Kapabacteria bacterium]|nr:polysaccharide biosynthesis C-terminal domain-containing protein [Candidatus Kapabacteria bacterium]
MKLTEQLGNGIWAMVDKSLPMLYGAAFLLVAKQMDAARFGVWVDFQLVWMVLTWLGDNFILQPMVKLASEDKNEQPALFSASFILYGIFLIGASVLVWSAGDLWRITLHSDELPWLMRWMSAMLLANYLRNLTTRILQVDYEIVKIFWLDVIYYGVVIGVIIWYVYHNEMHEPIKMVYANVWGAAASSLLGIVLTWKNLYIRHSHRGSYSRIYKLGIYQGGTGGLLAVQTQMDGILVGLIRTPTDVAIYQVAKTFYRAFEAIRDGVGLIILPMTSRFYAEKDQHSLIAMCEKIIFFLFLIILPAVVILIAGGQFLFDTIYHGKYDSSVIVFQIFTVGALALPFMIIGLNVLLGIGQTRPLFRITLLNTIIFLALLVALTIPFGSTGAAIALTTSSLLYAGACMRGTQVFIPISIRGIISRASDLKHFLRRYLGSR